MYTIRVCIRVCEIKKRLRNNHFPGIHEPFIVLYPRINIKFYLFWLVWLLFLSGLFASTFVHSTTQFSIRLVDKILFPFIRWFESISLLLSLSFSLSLLSIFPFQFILHMTLIVLIHGPKWTIIKRNIVCSHWFHIHLENHHGTKFEEFESGKYQEQQIETMCILLIMDVGVAIDSYGYGCCRRTASECVSTM